MTAHYEDGPVQIWHGDCIDVMRQMPDASVDAVVTDPPYGLEFMGREWDKFDGGQQERWQGRKAGERFDATGMGATTMGDRLKARPSYGSDSRGRRCLNCGHYKFSGTPCTCAEPRWEARTGTPPNMKAFQAWCEEWAREAYRLLKPGGHLLAFGGTRTFHRLAAGIEDAGFEIRDSIAWLYGSGFPKSLDVSKAIQTKGGRPEDIRRLAMGDEYAPSGRGRVNYDHGSASAMNGATEPVQLSEDAARWQGWGTALKPAFEPIVVARKPLAGTVAANVLQHGTGALNIDGSRIGTEVRTAAFTSLAPAHGNRLGAPGTAEARRGTQGDPKEYVGRWPANVVLDESQAAALDAQSGERPGGAFRGRQGTQPGGANGTMNGGWSGEVGPARAMGDSGGASRFFYTAKASTDERPSVDGIAHPTVKPVDLMRWLVKLVTPPGGTVLEPFAGSGTTVEACVLEGFHCIAIEREADYLPLILQRIRKPHAVGLDLDGWDDTPAPKPSKGRWPSNVILSESQADVLDEQSGERPGFSGGGATSGAVRNEVYGDGWKRNPDPAYYGDSGGASRFFKTVPDPEPVAFDFGEWEA